MPMLKSAKQEAFAQALARGESASNAYACAGYPPHASNAARLAKQEHILVRVSELLAKRDEIERKATEKAIDKLAITKEKVLAEMAKIGFSDIRKVLEWGEGVAVATDDGQTVIANGVKLRASKDLTDEAAAAISEIKQAKDGTLTVKLYNKESALTQLGKHVGVFIDRMEIGGPGEFANMTEQELLDEDERLTREIEARMHDGPDTTQ